MALVKLSASQFACARNSHACHILLLILSLGIRTEHIEGGSFGIDYRLLELLVQLEAVCSSGQGPSSCNRPY